MLNKNKNTAGASFYFETPSGILYIFYILFIKNINFSCIIFWHFLNKRVIKIKSVALFAKIPL